MDVFVYYIICASLIFNKIPATGAKNVFNSCDISEIGAALNVCTKCAEILTFCYGDECSSSANVPTCLIGHYDLADGSYQPCENCLRMRNDMSTSCYNLIIKETIQLNQNYYDDFLDDEDTAFGSGHICKVTSIESNAGTPGTIIDKEKETARTHTGLNKLLIVAVIFSCLVSAISLILHIKGPMAKLLEKLRFRKVNNQEPEQEVALQPFNVQAEH